MAKKFSLESVLSLVDGVSAPMAKIEKNVLGYSKKIQRHMGGFGKDVMKADAAFNRAAIGAAKWGIATASAAAVGGAALFQMTANSADEFAKTARTIGITTEELQALTYAAGIQGIKGEALTGMLEKMNKSMGELRTGSGALATYIGKVDKGFLKTLQSTGKSEDAFRLLMEAINNTPDEFGKAALATAAFGRSGMDILRMAEAGSKGIKQLTDEARAYGLVSDDAANQAEKWNDELARIQTIGKGVINRAFNLLIPKMSDFAERLRMMIFNSGLVEKAMVFLSQAIEKVNVDKLIEGVIGFAVGVKNAIVYAIKFFKALQPYGPAVLWIATSFIKLIGSLEPYIPLIIGIIVVFKVFVTAITVANAVLALMALNPVTLTIIAIVAGIALLTIGIINLSKYFGGFDKLLLAIGQTLSAAILTPINAIIDVIKSLISVMGMIPGLGGLAENINGSISGMQGKMNMAFTGNAGSSYGRAINAYASPDTRVAESRSYSESRTTNEVFVRADRGASVSDSPGGAPRRSLSYGRSQ